MFFLLALIFSAQNLPEAIKGLSETSFLNARACVFSLNNNLSPSCFQVETYCWMNKTEAEVSGKFLLNELPSDLKEMLDLVVFSVYNRNKNEISEEQEIDAKLAWILQLLKPGGTLFIPVSSKDYEEKHEVDLTSFLPELYQGQASRVPSSTCPLSQVILGPCEVIIVKKEGTLEHKTHSEIEKGKTKIIAFGTYTF